MCKFWSCEGKFLSVISASLLNDVFFIKGVTIYTVAAGNLSNYNQHEIDCHIMIS